MFWNRIINTNFSESENHIFTFKKLKNKPILTAFIYVLTNLLNGKNLGATSQNINNEITRSCLERETIGIKKKGGARYSMLCVDIIDINAQ